VAFRIVASMIIAKPIMKVTTGLGLCAGTEGLPSDCRENTLDIVKSVQIFIGKPRRSWYTQSELIIDKKFTGSS
jgi:hypothetical protein